MTRQRSFSASPLSRATRALFAFLFRNALPGHRHRRRTGISLTLPTVYRAVKQPREWRRDEDTAA
jgi:hypothetical protein